MTTLDQLIDTPVDKVVLEARAARCTRRRIKKNSKIAALQSSPMPAGEAKLWLQLQPRFSEHFEGVCPHASIIRGLELEAPDFSRGEDVTSLRMLTR
jgi:hypothetical protein